MSALLDVDQVLALAPDDASAKAARGLTAAAKWPTLGASDAAAWGECQGSGAKPYQTQVDLSGPAFRCSCPSRKFPCKHGLALLLLRAEDAQLFAASTTPPAWVSEWLASRGEKAQKAEARQAENPAKPVDAQAGAHREAQRWQQIERATQELQRWLADQIGQGLGGLTPERLQGWQAMAARMVDAQAAGLSFRLIDAAAGINRGEDWPEQTLRRLGLLQLICDAVPRRADLAAAVRADLRAVLGWPHDRAEVLATGVRIADDWTVLGVTSESRDDKLTERRVWLQGTQSGRRACLLDHAFRGAGFEQTWLSGSRITATLAFYPGAQALRAVCAVTSNPADQACAPISSVDAEWGQVTARVAACAWTALHPVLLGDAVVIRAAERFMALAQGCAFALALGEADGWRLLAVGGGQPGRLMGEWDGQVLKPLTLWAANELLWQRSPS